VNEDESLRRYGLSPVVGDLDEIRKYSRSRRRASGGTREMVIPS
jgi:hypothetical protein